MNKKIVWILALLLIVGSVSAWDWDNVKSYDSEKKEVTITNALGLGSDLAKYKLTHNTNQCYQNCEAIGEATLYSQEKLFTDMNFKNRVGDDVNVEYTIYILKEITEEVIRNEFKEICSLNKLNETNKAQKEECHNELVEVKKNITTNAWIPYDGKGAYMASE